MLHSGIGNGCFEFLLWAPREFFGFHVWDLGCMFVGVLGAVGYSQMGSGFLGMGLLGVSIFGENVCLGMSVWTSVVFGSGNRV